MILARVGIFSNNLEYLASFTICAKHRYSLGGVNVLAAVIVVDGGDVHDDGHGV